MAATGLARLPDVERYLHAAARRLERLPDATAVDRDRMSSIHELERSYRERLAANPGAEGLREVPWMLEELRVSHFAQALGTKGPISAKRDPARARGGHDQRFAPLLRRPRRLYCDA